MLMLHFDEISDCPEIISKMQIACRSDSAYNSFHIFFNAFDEGSKVQILVSFTLFLSLLHLVPDVKIRNLLSLLGIIIRKMNLWESIKASFKNGSYLNRLIYINLAVFVLVIVVRIIFFLFKIDPEQVELSRWFGLPASMKLFFLKPWTIITSMFYHEQVLHILFNMLWLYWFGMMLMQNLGQKKLLSTYLLGGITGAGFYLMAYSLFPVFAEVRDLSVAYGASAAVSAIVIAMVILRPNQEILLFLIGPVKLKYIGIFYVLSDLIQLPMGNPGGHIAHLGGAFWGYYYIAQANKGIDRAAWFDSLLVKFFNLFQKKSRLHVSHKRNVTDYEYNAMKRARQEEIDQILEKIQKSGYSSLSQKEKDTLFNASGKKNG